MKTLSNAATLIKEITKYVNITKEDYYESSLRAQGENNEQNIQK